MYFPGGDSEAEGSCGTVAQLERRGAGLISSLRDSWSHCVVKLQASPQSLSGRGLEALLLPGPEPLQ